MIAVVIEHFRVSFAHSVIGPMDEAPIESASVIPWTTTTRRRRRWRRRCESN
jgi:hypothetical protein